MKFKIWQQRYQALRLNCFEAAGKPPRDSELGGKSILQALHNARRPPKRPDIARAPLVYKLMQLYLCVHFVHRWNILNSRSDFDNII